MSTMGFVLNPEVLTTTDESKTMDYSDRIEKYSLTYKEDQSKFDRAVGVLRALATGDGNHIWSGEDRDIFINGVLPVYPDRVFAALKNAVFKGLEPNQILMMLNNFICIDVPSCHYFVGTRRHWFVDGRSIKAMSVEHLEQVKLVVFDGDLSKMIEFAFADAISPNPISQRIMMKIMTASELKISFFFGRGVPFKYLETMITFMDDHAPDLLVDSLVRLIDIPMFSRAVQDMLFRRMHVIHDSRVELLSLIKQVYTEVRKPSPESWTATLFHSDFCHTWSDDYIDVGSGETIVETPFCTDCNEYGGNAHPCNCEPKFHLDVCEFLMKRYVKIPPSFWRKVAYYNLYHLPHYLHINRPYGFYLDIGVGCVRNMIEFDSTAFAQFLVQYQYNQSTEIHDEIQRSCGRMSSQMKAILKPGSKKRQREHLAECQSLLDENSKAMPEGFYIEMSKLFKSGYA